MRPVTPCKFYFNHILARTPLAFSSLISLNEAARIPSFASLSTWSSILRYLQAAVLQKQHGQWLQKLSWKQTVKLDKWATLHPGLQPYPSPFRKTCFVTSLMKQCHVIFEITFHLISWDPGAASCVGRKGATKVFKYGRKYPWVPTLTELFPKI